eukprot:6821920-Alexandrium_andersonii.AAC.1
MSASLVGSEMCIRDRTPYHASPGAGGAALRARSPGVSGFRRFRAAEGAVSYTHLTLPTICSV